MTHTDTQLNADSCGVDEGGNVAKVQKPAYE
jgi:hypothetical protein